MLYRLALIVLKYINRLKQMADCVELKLEHMLVRPNICEVLREQEEIRKKDNNDTKVDGRHVYVNRKENG